MDEKFSIPSIAVIGGGFCGTMIVSNLVSKAHQPLNIFLIEKSAKVGKGIAYGTEDPHHLLNVYASKMGALADNPEHFFHWVLENETIWRAASPSFKQLKLTQHAFLPRQVYALYLEFLLKGALKEALSKNINISIYRQEAVNLENVKNRVRIFFREGEGLIADAAILSIGLPPSKIIDSSMTSNRYIQTIWNADTQFFTSLPPETKTVIVGSGLTMVDAIITLLNRGYCGEITAISKHGLLPQAHREIVKTYPVFLDIRHPPRTALQLLQIIRKEIEMANEKGYDWRSIIDSLRPITPAIWEQLPLKEKQKILRFLFTSWNRHRHRIPPECLDKIEQLQAQGKLILTAGKVQNIEQARDQTLLIKYRVQDTIHTLYADYLINCSGAEMNLKKNDSLLIQNLLKNKFILPDPLNLGIQANQMGEVKGAANRHLFAVGQILFGERFETIAVPELRMQCSQLAEHLLNKLNHRVHREHKEKNSSN